MQRTRATLGILLLSAALAQATNAQAVSNDTGRNPSPQQGQAPPQANAQPGLPASVQDAIQRIARALEAANQKQPSAEEKVEAARNLAAQEKIARWAPYVFWAAFGEFLITAAGVLLVWRTLLATRAASRAARDQVTATITATAKDLRPYVFLSIRAIQWPNVTRMGPGNQPFQFWNLYSVRLTIKNAGKTWAQNVRLQRQPVENPAGDAWDSITWNVANESPLVLAPGEEIELQFADVQRTGLAAIESGQRRIFFAAWVTYDDPLTEPIARRMTQLYRRMNADTAEDVSFTWMDTHNCADDGCA